MTPRLQIFICSEKHRQPKQSKHQHPRVVVVGSFSGGRMDGWWWHDNRDRCLASSGGCNSSWSPPVLTWRRDNSSYCRGEREEIRYNFFFVAFFFFFSTWTSWMTWFGDLLLFDAAMDSKGVSSSSSTAHVISIAISSSPGGLLCFCPSLLLESDRIQMKIKPPT